MSRKPADKLASETPRDERGVGISAPPETTGSFTTFRSMTGKKDILATALRYTGANRLLRSMGAWRGLVVLNYHRIGDPSQTGFDEGVFSATQEQFEAQLRYISRRCDLIGVKDLDRALLDRRGRYAIVTFDDGYRDNYELAFPVLQRLRHPAIFFLTTGFLDDGLIAWWDEIAWMVRNSSRRLIPVNRWMEAPIAWEPESQRGAIRELLRLYKRLPQQCSEAFLSDLGELSGAGRCPREASRELWMTWDMVREMRQAGLEFGGHTVRHPILARCAMVDQWWEISVSKKRIEAELGESIDAFSYPVGAPDCFDETTRSCLERCGYRWAFSFHGGFVTAGEINAYNIPRYPIAPEVTPERLSSLLTLPQIFAQL